MGRSLQERDVAWADANFKEEPMDFGIVRCVRLFQEAGIETCQSCVGGEGHSYRYPTVDLFSRPWTVLDVARDHDLPVMEISQRFGIRDFAPVEHFWRVEFSPIKLKALLAQPWYTEPSPEGDERLV